VPLPRPASPGEAAGEECRTPGAYGEATRSAVVTDVRVRRFNI
jgi:hypothetical protein